MSSRVEGFAVMDVSTSLPDDPKVKRLARDHPDQLGPGFLVYVATMAESWRAGERVTYDDAWPGYLAFDQSTVDALKHVRLLDSAGRVTASAWRGYFVQARDRREKSRERWRRANEARVTKPPVSNGKHHADPALLPRGSDAATAPPSDSDSVPSDSESESPGIQGRRPSRPRASSRNGTFAGEADEPQRHGDPEEEPVLPWRR